MPEALTLKLVLLGVLLLFGAFFSIVEASFLAVQSHRLRHLVTQGSQSAQIVEEMREKPETFLSAVLVGDNLVDTAVSALTTTLALALIGTENVAVVSAIVVAVTATLLVEVTPKAIAARHADRLALVVARPFRLVSWVLTPLTVAFSWFASWTARLVGGSLRRIVSIEELETMVQTGVEEGSVEEQEAELVRKVFRFGDRMVREVMTPRTEIASVKQGTTFDEFLSIFAQASHSRFPVYAAEPDHVLGILAIRDLLQSQAAGTLTRDSPVTTTLQPAHFVPETKRIADLLEEMRALRTQIVLVVDEFGSVAGLVTLRRLVEEIVGRVEEPGEVTPYRELDERTLEVEGSLRIEELAEQVNIALPPGEGRYQTVAGFILAQLGHIPQEGEEVHYPPYHLTVLKMQGPRIERVRIRTGEV